MNRVPTEIAEDRYLQRILAILKEQYQQTPVNVYLFGSRATGKQHERSDYDLAVQSTEDVSLINSLCREQLHDSTIPYFVDLVDMNTVSHVLQQDILQHGVLIWSQ